MNCVSFSLMNRDISSNGLNFIVCGLTQQGSTGDSFSVQIFSDVVWLPRWPIKVIFYVEPACEGGTKVYINGRVT